MAENKKVRRTRGEGSVYMRKDGRAAASAMYEGKRITKYGKNKTEAKQKLQAYLDDLKAGKVVIGPKQTVKQYLEHWLENSRRLKIEVTSLIQYRSILRAHLIPAFGHLQLSQLTREHLQAFYAEKLDSGLSPRRIKGIHVLLSSALRDAVINGMLAQNVCEHAVLPRAKKHKPHVLKKEECKRLVAAARGRRLWFLILLAITTGARLGELLALHSEQKDYIEQVRQRSGARWKGLDLVFPNRDGSYLNADIVRREFRAVLREAGLSQEITPHDLRHSMATLLFAAGVNAKVVQEALGHSSVAITLGLYGDVLPDMQQETADVMDQLFE